MKTWAGLLQNTHSNLVILKEWTTLPIKTNSNNLKMTNIVDNFSLILLQFSSSSDTKKRSQVADLGRNVLPRSHAACVCNMMGPWMMAHTQWECGGGATFLLVWMATWVGKYYPYIITYDLKAFRDVLNIGKLTDIGDCIIGTAMFCIFTLLHWSVKSNR